MANLTRTYRWERFSPDLGDNLEQPEGQRLELEIASGLSKAQLAALATAQAEALKDASTLAAALDVALAPFVRVRGQHTVDGQPVETLRQYLDLVLGVSGIYNVQELLTAIREFNSIEGTQRLFSQRHSGGLLSTRAQGVGRDSAPTGGR